MTHWFEDLTKTMADEKMGRRAAIGHVAGTVVGAALAGMLPGTIQAKQNKQCPNGCDPCAGGECVNCMNNPNTNCYCFMQSNGTPVCGCNMYCSQASLCSASSQCKKGFACIPGAGCYGCPNPPGICLPICKGKHKNCQLGSGHGSTAAGRVL
jgi:hypothetical protein